MLRNLFLSFCLWALLPATAGAVSQEEAQRKLEKWLEDLPGKTYAAVHVEVLGAGRVLLSHQSERLMVPASSMKLMTTALALDQLGPAGVLYTKVYSEGKVQGEELRGNLVLAGEGDPYLVSERLWMLAKDIARSGVKKITGGIKVNNSAFAGDYLELTKWAARGSPFAAPVSATSLNFNSAEVHVQPDIQGKNVLVDLGPAAANHIRIVNQAKLGRGKTADLQLTAQGIQAGKEVFTLSGTIGSEAEKRVVYATVSQPAAYIASMLAALLRKEGVNIVGDYAGAHSGDAASLGAPLATQESLSVAELAKLYNTFSNNFMAEQTFFTAGARSQGGAASLEKSREALQAFLRRQRICPRVKIDNGSGLSWTSAVDAKCFVDLLQYTYRDFRTSPDFLGSLPVGGQTGTLKNRFRRAGPGFVAQKVRAKTGSIWSDKTVSSLVGFTQTHTGEPVAFAILLNDDRSVPAQLAAMRDWEDRCVELLQSLSL